jgi:hypothetical protein
MIAMVDRILAAVRRPPWWAIAAAAVVVVVVTGLVVYPWGPEPVVVNGRATGSAQVPAGRALQVDFGRVSSGVGDAWFLTGAPDAAILADRGQGWSDTPDCQGVGCERFLVWRFDALRAGTTSVTFQYCYRSFPPECQAEPSRGPTAPVVLTVTVT